MKRFELFQKKAMYTSLRVDHFSLDIHFLKVGLKALNEINELLKFWKTQSLVKVVFEKTDSSEETFSFKFSFKDAAAHFQLKHFPNNIEYWKKEKAEECFLEHLNDVIIEYQNRLDYLGEDISEEMPF